jgi:hypothetical protein
VNWFCPTEFRVGATTNEGARQRNHLWTAALNSSASDVFRPESDCVRDRCKLAVGLTRLSLMLLLLRPEFGCLRAGCGLNTATFDAVVITARFRLCAGSLEDGHVYLWCCCYYAKSPIVCGIAGEWTRMYLWSVCYYAQRTVVCRIAEGWTRIPLKRLLLRPESSCLGDRWRMVTYTFEAVIITPRV